MTAQALQIAAFQRDVPFSAPKGSASQGVFPSYRVRVEGNRSTWNEQLLKRFNQLTKLPQGWDGYRGQAVSFACASFASQILERLCIEDLVAPSLVPGSDGTMQIEWHKNRYDIELDVLGPNSVHAYRNDQVSGLEEELDVQNDLTEVMDWLRSMTVRNSGQEIAE